MTTKEFSAFCRSIAIPAVELKRGEISQEKMLKTIFTLVGKEIVEETESLLDEYDTK